MGERKVLNKYFPPDFDPSKLPKRHFDYDAPMGIRMMLPFNLCCLSCGHYMYQGKKFNSKKETAKGMDYLGIKRLRFTIKCEVCYAKITFLTDPKNQDYECESGATRNYSKWREEKNEQNRQIRKQEGKIEEEKLDSMQMLESRTLDSKREMDVLDALEEIKNKSKERARSGVDPTKLLDEQRNAEKAAIMSKEEEELEKFRTLQQNKRLLMPEKDNDHSTVKVSDENVQKLQNEQTQDGSDEEGVLVVRKRKKRKIGKNQ